MKDLLRDPAASEEGQEEAVARMSNVDAGAGGTAGSGGAADAGEGVVVMGHVRMKGYGDGIEQADVIEGGVGKLVFVESRDVQRLRGELEARGEPEARWSGTSRCFCCPH